MRADDIIDRQRLRRKLTFWRIASFFVALIGVGVVVAMVQSGSDFAARSGDHVAKVKISGTIDTDEGLLERLAEIEKSDSVKGVILTINSPGGTTVGGEAIFEAVRKISAKKPIVAQVGTLAASAGYMIAAGSDHIVAHKSSIVGSIGVIFQYPNFQGMLDNLGIDVRAIKSSPLKAEPSFFGQTPPEAEAMIRNMILDSYDWFKGIVAERRDFTTAETDALADGSVFTGRQALENGLIDNLGGEEVARAWLTEQGIDGDLKTLEWKDDERVSGRLFSGTVLRWIAAQIGLGQLNDPISKSLEQRLMLDGLVSVWHVQDN
ncbi:MAG: signal peptide peptidase SppA [Pseudomonadota bacterium]